MSRWFEWHISMPINRLVTGIKYKLITKWLLKDFMVEVEYITTSEGRKIPKSYTWRFFDKEYAEHYFDGI